MRTQEVSVSHWNFMDYASKDTLLEVMNREAEAFIALCSDPVTWQQPTASGHWEVRDVAGHLVDTIEGYFPGFDAARGQGIVPEPLGLREMHTHVDRGALAFRGTDQAEVLERLQADRAKVAEIFAGLGEDDWMSLLVTHKYMGPLPACFYAVFQLVDWAIHSWDIRQATGRAHILAADTADLLVPVSFVLWQYTVDVQLDTEPVTIGVRVSGRNGGTTRIAVTPEGVTVVPGDVSDLPVVDFDPASFVLTAFGRINAGSADGDLEAVKRFLNAIFRV
jgi:uncharacterized protein (TIGR03083 family)